MRRNDDGLTAFFKAIDDGLSLGPAESIAERTSAIRIRPDNRWERGRVETGASLMYHGFELARVNRGKDGTGRLILVNGDQARSGGFGNPLGSVQRDVLAWAERSPVPSIVVPFTAIEAAGIRPESISPIDVERDRWEERDRESFNVSDVPSHSRPSIFLRPDGTVCDWFDHDSAITDRTRTRLPGHYYGHVPRVRWFGPNGERLAKPERLEGPDHTCRFVHKVPGDIEPYRWTESIHHLGASLFRASWQVSNRIDRPGTWETCEYCGTGSGSGKRFGTNLNGTGDGSSHWCDEPLRSRSLFLSAFDTETARKGRPVYGMLYFLAQLPAASRAKTIPMALGDLAPDIVHYRRSHGFDVVRQGDVFGIETDLTTAELRDMGGSFGRKNRPETIARYRTLQSSITRLAEQVARAEGMLADGTATPEQVERWREQLPAAKRDLAGDERDLARILPIVSRFLARYGDGSDGRDGTVHESHKATYTCTLPDGRTYARGSLYHRPEGWRQPEHCNIKLGSGREWYRILPNTVPRSFGMRAWTISGGVD